MFLIPGRRLWPCAWLFGASWAAANPSDPTDPQAPVAPPVYSSAFAGYRTSGDLSPRPWRDSIDTVARRGGWRAYAREAAQGADRSDAPTEPHPARPAPADASPRSKAAP